MIQWIRERFFAVKGASLTASSDATTENKTDRSERLIDAQMKNVAGQLKQGHEATKVEPDPFGTGRALQRVRENEAAVTEQARRVEEEARKMRQGSRP